MSFDWSESLTIGRAVADWLALRKGEYYGILDPEEQAAKAAEASATAGAASEDLPDRTVEMMVSELVSRIHVCEVVVCRVYMCTMEQSEPL